MKASDHTRLINRFIGLCKKGSLWPSLLHDEGYRVELIEHDINTIDAHKVKPDVIALSNRNCHILVTDCKSGSNIDRDQDARYGQLDPNDLAQHIDNYTNQLDHTFCYSVIESNHNKLKPHTSHPFIVFGRDQITASGDFKNRLLNQIFKQPTSLAGMYDSTRYYPFSPDDDRHLIILSVLYGILFCITARRGIKFDVSGDELPYAFVKIIHPFYDMMDRRFQARLSSKIKEAIEFCKTNDPDFETLVSDMSHYAGTVPRLVGICERLIQKYDNPQLDDYMH